MKVRGVRGPVRPAGGGEGRGRGAFLDPSRLPVAVFLEEREDFAPQACRPRLDEALHVDQEAALLTVRVARHEVLQP